jgi:ubiquinone/menaquinone biosynthesis C-methylase UbiE
VSGREDKKAESREYFDRNAAGYERQRRWRSVREPQARAIAALELEVDDRLLDVGCGTGAAVREAAPRVVRAVGLDLSPGMIEEAKRLAQGLASAEFQVGDAEALPFAGGEFTAVLCTTSIHHYPNPGRAIGEMARVLAPGGRLVIGDANRDRFSMRLLDRFCRRFQASHVRILSSAELEHLLAEAGLVGTVLLGLRRGSYMIALAEKESMT